MAVIDEALGALAQLFLDGLDGAQHGVARRHVVRTRVDGEARQLLANTAGQRIEQFEAFDFVVEQRQAQRQLGAFRGKMSMVSPRTRNTPRVNSASLRVYCMATSRARISRREIWSPARRISTIAW